MIVVTRMPNGTKMENGESKAIVVRPAEVLGPAETPAAETVIERLIEKKLAEMKERSTAETLFEPFFRSKAIADEIRRHQTITEQQKWSLYYEKFGCLICQTRNRPHDALGMCDRCYQRIHGRLKALLKEAESGQQTITDLTEQAQTAFESPVEIQEPPNKPPRHASWCRVCQHPEREAIERDYVHATKYGAIRAITRKYGLKGTC